MTDGNRYERETSEFQEAIVRVGGVKVFNNVKLFVGAYGMRPPTRNDVEWKDPTVVDGLIGVMVTDYAKGQWNVWGRVASMPETPIFKCGFFIVE